MTTFPAVLPNEISIPTPEDPDLSQEAAAAYIATKFYQQFPFLVLVTVVFHPESDAIDVTANGVPYRTIVASDDDVHVFSRQE